MELKEYWYIIKKRLILIISFTLLCGAISGIITTFVIDKIYTADISVLIGKQESSDSEKTSTTYNDILMYQKIVKTYSQIAKSRKVADDVKEKLSLNMSSGALLGSMSVSSSTDTEFMTIRFSSKDPELAAKITNQWAASLKEISKKIKGSDNVQILDNALVPSSPSSPNVRSNVIMTLFFGFVLSIGLTFLVDYLDNTVKSEDDLSKILDSTVLGSIPDLKFEE
ncbi:YveK family protein [Clostridium cellulovorans]|uniref:Lipopolysaccharide biosynthesis protein n=1 Tax=Clostridium cellulovorans (strain ATCC 35296 / DSM 3052 / OCM 3 / 743B) TaxID=573061 RepID=D9SR42_CLOC7|nr:Wzz/FepE/Etk N-terminal domain-containing protein [Clostridium cellulovorans]ADL50330.1 lipopolysaccharide biosynthesis protein [Clostridium cellulovorans 743B]